VDLLGLFFLIFAEKIVKLKWNKIEVAINYKKATKYAKRSINKKTKVVHPRSYLYK